ncbi:ABC transporter substrate-binding protein [Thioclava sp. JM3]|uniref:ABC transporter substrate-binding protein n=1 Tax=Thioclava nitratireducens TaxID=1915078 RepID=A0ABM6II68_9RHOB|nr:MULTISPECIES: ABC transporter substrate-binding protein [Thioclava]AQS48429.1 ABC transporter substrate-binding protein [Thioclava nitratireducens]OWY04824.1 ABC transporter substrate-binding protein [Thioclava sp. F1Mire-8]OWY15203.1 ABC transporter substrate-binding protein [Thioclava sp. F34-6]OWY18644.1 ABC transporter substrate-binding protein [Thioclava sp. JM3]PWE50648.1 ABC transporter substrate-binding protein [Thioclava sp. NG1]
MTIRSMLLAGAAAVMMTAGGAGAKTLVYCSEASPEGFDPAPYTAGTTFDASSHPVYDQLVEFKPGTTEIEPGLAESWDVSDDGLTYTFNLRKGVKFHSVEGFTPSRDFNADDVIFSFDRQGNKDNPYYAYAPGVSYEYYAGMDMPTIIKSIEKVDDYTVKFTLSEPNAPFLADLAMDFASILSKEYADKLAGEDRKADINNVPVGTGPFSFVAYQKDAVIRYKANPDYFKGKTPVDDLIFAITPDPAVRMQKLQAGECQIMPYPAPADIQALKDDSNIKVDEQPGLNVAYLAYNTTQAPFDKVEVRKALNMAINKDAIIDAVFQGAGQVAKNPIPPTMWSYNKDIKDDAYDPEQAKKMLEDAGVKDLEMNIWAMPVQRPYMPNARRTAELMQSDLAKVGVKANIVSYEWGEYLKKSKDPSRDGAVILGWTGDNGDPDNFLAVLLGCSAAESGANRAFWCNQKFDDLITKARQSNDQAERTKLYKEAQEVFKEQAPWDTIAHSTVFMPMSKKVTGYVMSPLGGHDFYGVDISE